MSTNASQLVGLVRKFIPPLTNQLHKGQAGRVAVVGGSEDYTGAPFFAAISTLKLGSDLCHVFCEQNAGLVIKSYSAELIVHPYLQRAAENPKLAEPGKPEYNAALDAIVDRVVSVFHRLHVLVVGPGLSRDQALLDSTKRIIAKARQTGMPIVVDADGLFLVQNEPDVIKGYSSAILTPNANEFKRLCESMNISFDPEHKDSMAMRLSQALGHVTIVQKGDVDVISNGSKVWVCDSKGSPRRCGGQGDILSGSIAAFVAWAKGYEGKTFGNTEVALDPGEMLGLSAWAGCLVTRECSRVAFAKHGRSMTTTDMIAEIGGVFRRLFEPDQLERAGVL
ncbi:Ribokinase-like protein [Hyaloraphidium curvatum]|nr:Ribokinase-like protein [Hyaloraphidium curvatum]